MGNDRYYLILKAVQSEAPIDIDELVLKLNEDENVKSITKEQLVVLINQITRLDSKFKKTRAEYERKKLKQ